MRPFNLTIKQQGAGNGKTYELNMRMFDANVMNKYKNVFMLTKQHSAKSTIKSTLLKVEDAFLKDGYLDDYNYSRHTDECIIGGSKYYRIKYNLDNKSKMIIIATIDSLTYRLADHANDQNYLNIINHWVSDVVTNNLLTASDGINYGNTNIKIDSNTLIILDESQDLDPLYAHALIRIASTFGCDLYIVGDLLQSLAYEHNSLNYFMSIDFEEQKRLNMNVIVDDYSNVCRRFKNSYLRDFVNSVVPFEKFGLPPIKLNEVISNDPSSLQFIEIPNTLDLYLRTKPIMEQYIREVELNGREPKDFLMIFTIVKTLEYPEYLNDLINQYWSNKYKKSSNRYSYFHRGQEGTSINLDESVKATRIVSIHSSKGDGRPCVFVCSISEIELICMDPTKQLRYESLLHVALTRQEEKLFICYTDKMITDDVGRRFSNYVSDAKPSKFIPNLKLNLNYKASLGRLLIENNFRDIRDDIIDHTSYQYDSSEVTNNKIIDMGHHHIRYGAMFVSFILEAFHQLSDNESNMMVESINLLANKIWVPENGGCVFGNSSTQRFTNIIDSNRLVHLSKGGKNDPISNAIYFTSRRVHSFILPALLVYKPIKICSYEALVFYYMYNTFRANTNDSVHGWKSPISINELYKITETYYATYVKGMPGHTDCTCTELFANKAKSKRQGQMYYRSNTHISSDIINKEYAFLCNYYESLTHIMVAYKSFIKSSSAEWLFYENFISNNQVNVPTIMDIFNIEINHCGITFVGKGDRELTFVYLRPTYGALKYNEHIIQSIYNEHILRLILNISDNIQINHVVFTASGNHKYEYSYDRKLMNDAIPTINRHFLAAYKFQTQPLINELSNLYDIIYNQLKKSKYNYDDHTSACTKYLTKRKSNQKKSICYNTIITSNLFQPLYRDINQNMSPEMFKCRLEQIIYDYNQPMCMVCI